MSQFKQKTVAVLMGGLSREREISFRSGQAVSQALRAKGYRIVEIDVGIDLPQKLLAEAIDVAYLALHGRYGEDGSVQGLLECMQIPYTHSGVLSSAIAMDKVVCKRLLQERGFLTPRFCVYEERSVSLDDFLSSFSIGFPSIVKPANEGSTLGIERVENRESLRKALESALHFDSKILCEEWIDGREVTAGVVVGQALPIVEVIPKKGFYDFEAKYTKGATIYEVPALFPDSITIEIQQTTVEIFQELGCEGCARADYLVDRENQVFFLEINTIPGMTETSLLPKAAAAVGISFGDLVEKILNSARLKLKQSL